MNRKASTADWIPIIVFLIAITLIIFFFISYQAGQKDPVEENFLDGKKGIEINQILLNYLRSSAEIDDKELTFSEWINLLYHDNSLIKDGKKFFYAALKESNKDIGRLFLFATKNYFDKISDNYEIRITGERGTFRTSSKKVSIEEEDKVGVNLPHPEGDIEIKLKIISTK